MGLRGARGGRFAVLSWAAALACVLACAGAAQAQFDPEGRWENGVTEAWWLDTETFSKEEAARAAALWESIGEENARGPAGGWAGGYFRGGETHGVYMRWSPRAGFVIAHVNKCAALVTGLVYGRAEASPSLVRFFPEVDKVRADGHEGEHMHAAAPRASISYVPVGWRGERLLVAEGEMEDFGDYVAGLGRYNQWAGFIFLDYTNFFARVGGGDDSADADAPPVVPAGYERFLKRPVEASVVSVGRRVLRRDYHIEGENTSASFERVSLTYVTIDAGAEQGVKDGMVFRVVSPAEGDSLVVLRAGPRSSTAAVVRELDERGAETFYDNDAAREKRHSKVAAGWRLTTSLF